MPTPHVSSALAVEDIVIPQGATESSTWPTPWMYAEADPLAPPPGWPEDWSARMQIRDHRGPDSTVLATLRSAGAADGVLTLDTVTEDIDGDEVEAATVVPSILPATSAAWTWTAGVYDVELVADDGSRVIRLVEGNVTLSGEATTVA